MAGPHKFTKGLGGNYGGDGVMIAVVVLSVLGRMSARLGGDAAFEREAEG